MNLENLTVTGLDKILVTDSFNAPLLSFKLNLNENTIIPDNNELVITVKQNSNIKNYVFDLPSKLEIGNVFKIEPILENNKVTMNTSIEKNGSNHNLKTQQILLFEGNNEIKTNYQNASLEVVYPKNIDIVKYFFMNTFLDSYKENAFISFDDLYFKDAFTKDNNSLNLEVNRMSIDCLSSNNNHFSLDDQGNLNVNSITTVVKSPIEENTTLNNVTVRKIDSKNGSFKIDENGNLTVNTISAKTPISQALDFTKIYPVGSIYMSVNNTNPSKLFGGSWEEIAKGRTLVGVDTSQTEFNTAKKTGGEKNHKLTLSEIPSHSHNIGSIAKWADKQFGIGSGNAATIGLFDNVHSLEAGSNIAHNNLPPYFTCHIFQRIS